MGVESETDRQVVRNLEEHLAPARSEASVRVLQREEAAQAKAYQPSGLVFILLIPSFPYRVYSV